MSNVTVDARCPSCEAPLTNGERCGTCAIRLVGPDAARLWQVDQRLMTLQHERDALLAERTALLTSLRSEEPPANWQTAAVSSVWANRPETEPRSAQNTLLALGGGLLALAALVFAAVTYSSVGVVGQALILLTLTGLAAAAAPLAKSRGLGSTAETAAGVAVAFAVLDAWALQKTGLAGVGVDSLTWFAGSFAVISVLSLAHSWIAGTAATRLAGLASAHLPVPLLLTEGGASSGTWGIALALLALVDVTVVVGARASANEFVVRLRRDLIAFGVLTFMSGLVASFVAVETEQGRLLAGVGFGLAGLTAAAVGYFNVAGLSRHASYVTSLFLAVVGFDLLLAHKIGEPSFHALLLSGFILALALWGASGQQGWRDGRVAAIWLAAPAGVLATMGAAGQEDAWVAVGAFALMAVAGGLLAWTTEHSWHGQVLAWGAVGKATGAAASVPVDLISTRALLMAVVAVVAGCAVSVLPSRLRWGTAVGAGVAGLSAWWLFLGDRGTSTVEAYTLPLAGLLLLGGWVLRQQRPSASSWTAYGWGLAALLTPSALVVLDDGDDLYLVRAVVLLAGSLGVLLAGHWLRLQAPFVAGAATLTFTALRLSAPVIEAVPRWMSLGLAGVLLLTVGATYEARRRDLARARHALAALD